LINHNICSVSEAWQMASLNVSAMLSKHNNSFKEKKDDLVIFQIKETGITIGKVIKSGRIVFECT